MIQPPCPSSKRWERTVGDDLDVARGRCKCSLCVEVRRRVVRKLRAAGASLPAIGRVLGRDHGTVANLIKPRARK